MQDVYGNRYTYAHLGSVSKRYPVAKRRQRRDRRATSSARPACRSQGPAEADHACQRRHAAHRHPGCSRRAARRRRRTAPRPAAAAEAVKERLFANPTRPRSRPIAEETGQLESSRLRDLPRLLLEGAPPRALAGQAAASSAREHASRRAPCSAASARFRRPGLQARAAPNFSIRPAGRGAPRIDPKPILDGWKLLEATAIYRAAGKNPFVAPSSRRRPVLLMSKEALAARVLADPRRRHLRLRPQRHPHRPDRPPRARHARVPGRLRPEPDGHPLKCGHSFLTKSGNVSEHSSGNAVDIAAVNGTPILGHQGPRLDHRGHDPQAADAPGPDAAAPDHLADGHGRPDDGAAPTTPTTSTSASSRCSARTSSSARQARAGAVEQPVGQLRRAPDQHREPGRAHGAVEVLDQGQAQALQRARTSGSSSAHTVAAGPLFPFLQFDFPFSLGPADGRYLARPLETGAGTEVMVLRTLDAEPKPGRRPRRVDESEPNPEGAPISRVTVIGAEAFSDEDAARSWMTEACSDPEEHVEPALRSINRILHGHRIASHDPYVREVSREQAHRVRIGFGTGDELVDGLHSEAFLIPAVTQKRRQMLEPQSELASILGGRRPRAPERGPAAARATGPQRRACATGGDPGELCRGRTRGRDARRRLAAGRGADLDEGAPARAARAGQGVSCQAIPRTAPPARSTTWSREWSGSPAAAGWPRTSSQGTGGKSSELRRSAPELQNPHDVA